ncbi:MAG: hypothetical protein ACRELG_20905 [Gemmataceae bacterium]
MMAARLPKDIDTANHSGSYMVNEVLLLLEQRGILAQMEREAAQRL